MLSNLEYFILTLLQTGISTPYDLMSKAGISLGSSIPVLRRLLKRKLVIRSEHGTRGARRFIVLHSGRTILKEELAAQLKAHPTDLESMLRLACVAWMKKP